MPTISVDTFFACSLMVLLTLSAMAATSKILYPYMNNMNNANSAEKYGETSKYLLLNDGTPSDWGKNSQATPEIFGLAKSGADEPYALDIDKVSRLNSENLYALSYAEIFAVLRIPDTSFRIEIKPVFEVAIDLTATFEAANETTYQFGISTEKHGVLVQAELNCYVIAENYLNSSKGDTANGETSVNVTVPANVNGPALLIVLARSCYDSKIASFNSYAFEHNSTVPIQTSFLALSPLDYNLTVSYAYPAIEMGNVYALTFNYNSTLTQTSNDSQSASYTISEYLDDSPTLLVATGWNQTSFFIECTAYPQIPVQVGADFENSVSLSDVFAYTYAVTVNSVIYECTIWMGGPRT